MKTHYRTKEEGEQLKNRIVELRDQGRSLKQIAIMKGLSTSRVSEIYREAKK